MRKINRRSFIQKSASHTTLASLGTFAIAQSANALGRKIPFGIMGVGGRGSWLARAFARHENVEFAYVCDVDQKKAEQTASQIEEIQGKRPKVVQDFRTMLDGNAVMAVINATPDHWHALGTIHACQAGKHVYVEKPASQCLWEGRKMVEAAKKYKRIVQIGTQTRSASYAQHGVEFIKNGGLGDVHLVKVFNMKTRPELKPMPDQPTPDGLDYDTWLGPAPSRPFNQNHYNGGAWNWKWQYSGGDIINDAIHQIDLARWASLRKSPKTVYSTGSIYQLKDRQDSPDTQIVTYEFDGLTMVVELTLWTPYIKKITQEIRDGDVFPDWRFCSTRVEVYGTKGMMFFGRHGGGWQVFYDDWKGEPFEYGKDPIQSHIDNFMDCIVKGDSPNADIEEGHLSTALCHLANISHRVGNKKLTYNGGTERFTDNDEANALLKRVYRQPWIIPENI